MLTIYDGEAKSVEETIDKTYDYNRKDIKSEKEEKSDYESFNETKTNDVNNSNYSFDTSSQIISTKNLNYNKLCNTFDEDENAEPEYDKKKVPKTTPGESLKGKDYKKAKKIKPTSPNNFKEKEEHLERLTRKSVKSFSKLNDDEINPIDVLTSSEPDFMTNMYNIFILEIPAKFKDDPAKAYTNGITVGTYAGAATTTGRDFLDTPTDSFFSIIGMRTDGIEIAQKTLTVNDIKIAGQTVKKITGKVETPNRASFTIDLDQSMFILDAFHRLNSDWWAKEYSAYTAIEPNLLKGQVPQDNAINGKEFLLNYGMTPFHSDVNGKDKSVIDVIVEYDAAYQIWSRYNNKDGSNDLQEDDLSIEQPDKVNDRRFLHKSGRVQRYILHDCRFLGRSSAISFSHNSSDPIKATFPFVYRCVYKVNDQGFFY